MKTLVVGPSERMQGGITTVIKTQKESPLWQEWGCVWIGTTLSHNIAMKLLWVTCGWLRYMAYLPFADLVHIHFTDGISARRKSLFYYPAAWLGRPILLHFHAPSFDESEAPSRFAPLAKMFRGASAVIALSENWKLMILRHVPGANVRVVRNAVSAPSEVLTPESRQKTIVYAGILNDRKGYRNLLDAFARIADRFPDWNLLLAGDGEVEWARQRCADMGLSERVEIPGWVPRDKMLEALARSSVFCLPSLAEGFPMTVLEAFAYGCAVVTTPVGGLAEELEHGNDLIFVRPGEVDSLVEGLVAVLDSSELRDRLSRRSRELTRLRYGVEASMASLSTAYREAIA